MHSLLFWRVIWRPRPATPLSLTMYWQMWEEPIVPAMAYLPYQRTESITLRGMSSKLQKQASTFILWSMETSVSHHFNTGLHSMRLWRVFCSLNWKKETKFGSRQKVKGVGYMDQIPEVLSQGLCSDWCYKYWVSRLNLNKLSNLCVLIVSQRTLLHKRTIDFLSACQWICSSMYMYLTLKIPEPCSNYFVHLSVSQFICPSMQF